jgi:hypothetical protein
MRKAFAVLSVVFALAFVIGASMPAAEAGPCYYKCICSVPHKCCINNGVEVCKKVTNSPIQCTQVYPC